MRNLDISNLEIATAVADARPVFWLNDVAGADFHRLKLPRGHPAPALRLTDVSDFRVSASRNLRDFAADTVSYRQIEVGKPRRMRRHLGTSSEGISRR